MSLTGFGNRNIFLISFSEMERGSTTVTSTWLLVEFPKLSEAVKVITGKKPNLANRILHIDLENLDFNSTRTFRADECPICGTGKLEVVEKQELILEELCGRNRGKRTYSITPTETFDLDSASVSAIAKEKGFLVENLGDLGLSMRTNELSVNFMKRGSAVVVGSKDESDAITLYKTLLSKN